MTSPDPSPRVVVTPRKQLVVPGPPPAPVSIPPDSALFTRPAIEKIHRVLVWMIAKIDQINEETGCHIGDSPELLEAKKIRDSLARGLNL